MRKLSEELRADIVRMMGITAETYGIIEVSSLAETVRREHEAENVALEDIEALIMQQAELMSSAMLLDRGAVLSLTDADGSWLGEENDSVEVMLIGSGVLVRITEDGAVYEREFECEEFARSFAEGQRLRLGLAKPSRSCDQ